MRRYFVNQHFIVLNLYSVSIDKILVTEFITEKVSQNLNLMQNTYINTVIECLEQNIRKQIDCKRSSSTKHTSRVQNVRFKICK